MSSTVRAIDGGATPVRQAGRRGIDQAMLGPGSRSSRASTTRSVEELRAELSTGRFATTRPVLPELAGLFPGRGLRRGASYVVPGSTLLALALVAGSTQAGAWCGVVGMPDLGVEAVAETGVDLGRLALVPTPGPRWPAVVAALADAFDVLVIRPSARAQAPGDEPAASSAVDTRVRPAGTPAAGRTRVTGPSRGTTRESTGRITPGDAARLAARFRERGTTVLVDGEWPKPELRIGITESIWHGLGEGYGRLVGRQVTVTADRPTGGSSRSVRLWLPDSEGRIRVDDVHRTAPEQPTEPRLVEAGSTEAGSTDTGLVETGASSSAAAIPAVTGASAASWRDVG